MYSGQPVSALRNSHMEYFLQEISRNFSINPTDIDERSDLARYVYRLFTTSQREGWNDQWTYPGAEYYRNFEEKVVNSTRFGRPFFSLAERELIKLFYGFKEIEAYILSQVAEARKTPGVKIVSSLMMSNAQTIVLGCATVNYVIPLFQQYFFKIYWLFSNRLQLQRVELGMIPEGEFRRNCYQIHAVPINLKTAVSTSIWQGSPDSLEKLILDLIRDGREVALKHVGEGYFDIPLASFLQQYDHIDFNDYLPARLLQKHIFLVQLMRYFNIYFWSASDSFFPADLPRATINATQITVGRLLNLYFESLFKILFNVDNMRYYADFGIAYTFSNEEMLSSGSSSGHNSARGSEPGSDLDE